MDPSEELSVWVDRLKAGDEEAADVIWQHCFEKMKRVAKNKLGPTGQRGADEEDIALSAMNSFMIRCREGKFDRLEDREDLWKLLFTITVRKAYQYTRKQMAAKRSGEVAEHQLRQVVDGSTAAGLDNFPDERAVTAEAIVEQLEQQDAFNETIQRLDASLQTVAVGKLSGQTNTELARQLNCSTRTIERKLKLIRKVWADAR